MQPVTATPLVAAPRPLEQRTVDLDPRRVDEQRYIAPRLHLVRHDPRRHPFRKPPRRIPQPLHVAHPQPCQPLPGTPRLGNVVQPKQNPRHRVGA